jgi:hypothetical protein
MKTQMDVPAPDRDANDDNRRDFLMKCGRFAAVTPPTVTMLLVTTMNSDAVAVSGGKGDNGWGNGGGDGTNNGSFNGNASQKGSKGADADR